jgi:flagellar motor switch protein FliG
MLLVSLDPGTAGELLKSVQGDLVAEIAAELACMGSRGGDGGGRGSDELARDFFRRLDGSSSGEGDAFVDAMLTSALGKDRSREVRTKVKELVEARDPFRAIASADIGDISRALAGESAQVMSLILSELPQKKSSQLLAGMDEQARAQVVCGMAQGQAVPHAARLKVAGMVRKRLKELTAPTPGGAGPAPTDAKDRQIRKLAVLLRDLAKEVRDGLTASLEQRDKQTADDVREKMIVWEDLLFAAERPLQEVLRTVDARTLALAMIGAEPRITAKIRQNISDRAGAMLDEEASLLSKPKEEDIRRARGEVVAALREAHSGGSLEFEVPE